MKIQPKTYESLESKNRIDATRAFFSVGREQWRFICGDIYVDVYMEGFLFIYLLSASSIRYWQVGKYEKFDAEKYFFSLKGGLREIAGNERRDIVESIVRYMKKRHWASVTVAEPTPKASG